MQYAKKVWREPGEPEIEQGAALFRVMRKLEKAF